MRLRAEKITRPDYKKTRPKRTCKRKATEKSSAGTADTFVQGGECSAHQEENFQTKQITEENIVNEIPRTNEMNTQSEEVNQDLQKYENLIKMGKRIIECKE